METAGTEGLFLLCQDMPFIQGIDNTADCLTICISLVNFLAYSLRGDTESDLGDVPEMLSRKR